jgi:hypothetical protein
MIVARNGQIAPETGHDHGPRPECLNSKPGHKGYNGAHCLAGLHYRTRAGTRAALPPRTILTSNEPRKTGLTDAP